MVNWKVSHFFFNVPQDFVCVEVFGQKTGRKSLESLDVYVSVLSLNPYESLVFSMISTQPNPVKTFLITWIFHSFP